MGTLGEQLYRVTEASSPAPATLTAEELGAAPAFASDDCTGMTTREWFAAQALAGLAANPVLDDMAPQVLAGRAVALADALLRELSR
jgi:hypothetical protein